MKPDTHRTPPTKCPKCHHPLNMATGVDRASERRGPQPGDATVCIQCTGFLIWGQDMQLRMMDDDEFLELEVELRTILVRARNLFNRMKKEKGNVRP